MQEEVKEFFLTQTALKDLEKDTTCPDRWRGLWLDKELTFPSNEDMDKGKYFEWLCLGGGAVTGQDVTDLPRTGQGKKTVDQIRIEEQVERFKELFNPAHQDYQGHTITGTQLELKSNGRKGTIDFESHVGQQPWINDLKLTKDATSTRSQYGWGHDWSELDLIQLVHYADLYFDNYGVQPKIGLWVFDYSPEKLVRFGEVVVSKRAKEKKEFRFQTAIEVIDLYKQNGWTKLPSENECKACRLNCQFRHKAPPIEKLIVNI